jgi:hypothetical protein
MSAASQSSAALGLGRLSDRPLMARQAAAGGCDHFAPRRVLERDDLGGAGERHRRHRERRLVERALRDGGARGARIDRADVQVRRLQDLDPGAQHEPADVAGDLAEQVGRQQCVDGLVGLAEANHGDDAALRGAAGGQLRAAVRQQPRVVRELALQELHGVGPGNAQHAETRQQSGAQRLCSVVDRRHWSASLIELART